MERAKKKMIVFIMLTVFIIAAITGAFVFNSVVTNKEEISKSISIVNEGEDNLAGVYLNTYGYNSYLNPWIGNFQISTGSMTYYDGYCMYLGKGSPWNVSDRGSAYLWFQGTDYNKLKWLFDNMAVVFQPINDNVYGNDLNNEITMYKKNLNILIGGKGNVDNLTPKQLFEVQQCVLWNFINGRDYSGKLTGSQLHMYNALIKGMNENSNYVSDGQSIVTVTKGDGFGLSSDGKIGPFILNNPNNQINQIIVEKFEGIDEGYTIIDENGNEINEYNKYNGRFFIKLNAALSKGKEYKITGQISIKSYKTNVKMWWDGSNSNQPVTTFTRDPEKSFVSFDSDFFSGNIDLALKKQITQINSEKLEESVRCLDYDAQNLINNISNDAIYNMRKSPISVEIEDRVTYKLQVFNESKELDGYAKEITDYIPEGLKFTASNINAKYNWRLYNKNGIEIRLTEENVLNILANIFKEVLKNNDSIESLKQNNELRSYYNSYVAGTLTLEDMISNIINSNEGLSNTSNLNDEDYISLLYKVILERSPESSEINTYKEAIKDDENNAKRKELVQTLLNTTEFRTKKYAKMNEEDFANVKYITTDSIQNEKLNKFTDEASLGNNSKYVEVDLEVTKEAKGILTNIAEITKYGYYDGDNFIEANKENVDIDSVQSNVEVPQDKSALESYYGKINEIQDEPNNYPGQQDDDDFEKIKVEANLDLALKKEIIKVEDSNYTRLGIVNPDPLKNGKTTAKYHMDKTTLDVIQGNIVTYRIYIFNEGSINATASEITDYLPAELEFLPNDALNKKYGWEASMPDSNGIVTLKTRNLENKLIDRYSKQMKENGVEINKAYVEVKCKVKETAESNLRVVNIAEITEYQTEDGFVNVDIDSGVTDDRKVKLPTTENWKDYYTSIDGVEVDENGFYAWKGQEDDDDFEAIKVNKLKRFDLALRKFITKVNNTEVTNRIPNIGYNNIATEGTASYKHTKKAVEVDGGDIVTYTIRVYNEGDLAGTATQITDYLPEGLEFYSAEVDGINYGWEVVPGTNGRAIKTNYLKDKNTLLPNRSYIVFMNKGWAEVKVKCKVSEEKAIEGLYLTNRAEITAHIDENGNTSNAVGVDRDSEPNNVKLEHGNEMLNYDSSVEYSSDVHYKGYQDDDDKETVFVKPTTNFKVNLLKVTKDEINDETPTALSEAKFALSEVDINDMNKVINTFDDVITKNSQIEIINKEKCKLGSTYLYKLEEKEAPQGFDMLINSPIYIKIAIGEDGTFKETRIIYDIQNGDDVSDFCKLTVEGNTINVRIANEEKEFDLALRKFITKIKRDGVITEVNTRNPNLNVNSLNKWKRQNTAGYYHTKEAASVKKNDIVTYKIGVYNEGFVKGYATQITDYLPEGLEFVANSSVNRNNGWNAVKNSDGTTTVTTNKLQNTLLNECALDKYVSGVKQETWYSDVEIECKVTKDRKYTVEYLTNRAEITEDKAVSVDSEGNETELNVEDRDSKVKNVKDEHSNEMLNYDENIEYSPNVHYEGYEDDDDKETVKIEPITDIEFTLKKIDSITKEEINGASFKIEALSEENKINSIVNANNEEIAKNDNNEIIIPIGGAKVTSKELEINKTYSYKITEISAPEKYEIIVQNMEININVDSKGNKTANISKMTVNEETANGTVTREYTNLGEGSKETAKVTLTENNEIIVEVANKNIQFFDLALRKNIDKVEKVDGTSIDYTQTRSPKLDISSVMKLNGQGTAGYYHEKQAITVETNDIITYTIKVYNESDLKGKVAQITDYLPSGLEFYSSEVDGIDYKWNVTKNSDGTSKLTTNYLKDTLLDENEILKSIIHASEDKWFAEVKVKCKVTKEADYSEKYLTNRAEITAAEDERGNKYGNYYQEFNNTDRDSLPDTIEDNLNLENHYKENVLDVAEKRYYEGEQDDDDFETVKLEKVADFDLSLIKKNFANDENLQVATKFTIQEINPNIDIWKGIKQEDILNTKTLDITGEGNLDNKTKLKINTEYRYKIIEEEVSNDFQKTVREVILKIAINKKGEASAQIEKYNDSRWNNVYSSAYTYLLPIENNSITVVLKNEPKGKYRVELEKVDENGNRIENNFAYFNLNNLTSNFHTEANGIWVIEDSKEITSTSQKDEYQISEFKAPEGYGKLEGHIVLQPKFKIENGKYVLDKENTSLIVRKVVNGRYEISNINLNTMGEKVGFYVEDGEVPTIKIKVENEPTLGKYGIKLEKVDANGNVIKDNKATFIVDGIKKETDANGMLTVVDNKNITQEIQIDNYSILEYLAPEGYSKYNNKIKLMVATKKEENTYTINEAVSVLEIENVGTVKPSSEKGIFEEGKNVAWYFSKEDGTPIINIQVKNPEIGKYKVELEKVDENGNVIKDNFAGFRLNRNTRIYNTNSEGIWTVEEGRNITSQNQEDIYQISEFTAPKGYIKYNGTINLIAKSKLKNGKLVLDTEKTVLEVEEMVNGETVKTNISLNEMGENVGFYIENGDVPTIKIKVKNTKIVGKYGIKIVKVDANGNPIKDNTATFEIDGTEKKTNANGILSVVDNKNIDEEVQTDTYSIKETIAPNGFVKYSNEIKLRVTTKQDGEKYVIDENNTTIDIANVGTYALNTDSGKIQDGKDVIWNINKDEETPIINIYVRNLEEGKYKVKLEKVDENGNVIKNNKASFVINNVTKPASTNENGILVIEDEKTITSTMQQDKYTVYEFDAPDGYEKYEGIINLSVKTKLENGKCVLDKENTTLEVLDNVNGENIKTKISLNEMGENVGFYIEDGNIPTIKIKVKNSKLVGKYGIKIVKVDANGNEIKNNKATFSVEENGEKISVDTNSEGILTAVEDVVIEGPGEVRNYVFTEEKAPKGFIKFKDKIKLMVVTKEENSVYTIDSGISVLEVENVGAVKVSTEKGKFEEGKNVSWYIDELDKNGIKMPVITIYVKNTPITGKFNIEIAKVDSTYDESDETQDKYIDGVVFNGLDNQKIPIGNKTTGENGQKGKAVIAKDVEINYEGQKFTYVLREESVPEGYTKIQLHDILVSVNTGLSADGESYEIKDIRVETVQTNGNEFTEQEKAYLEKGLKATNDNSNICITVPNQPTTNYEFELVKKHKDNDTFVENARFTIDGPDGNIQTDTIIQNGETKGVFVHSKENVRIDNTYSYLIKETFAPMPYINVFEKFQIKVEIAIDDKAKIDLNKSSARLVYPEDIDLSNAENRQAVALANQCLGKLELDPNNSKKVRLVLKNPEQTRDYSLSLFKHHLGNKNEEVAGAKFNIQKKENNNVNWTLLNDSLITSKDSEELIDKQEKIKLGNVYYYLIEETEKPNKNYRNQIQKAIVKITVSDMGEVTGEITEVQEVGNTDFVAYNKETHEKYVELIELQENKFVFKFANSISYHMRLIKREDSPVYADIIGYRVVEGGQFKIEKITRDSAGRITTEELYDGPATWDYTNKEANPNSIYEYYIQEIASPNGLNNDFENVKIHLTIRTDANGNVAPVGRGGTNIDFESSVEGVNLQDKIKSYLYTKCVVQVENNTVSLNLKDSKIIEEPNKYGLQIVKVDKENIEKKLEDVEFSVVMNTSNHAGIPYDANDAETGIQNPKTDPNGIINIKNLEIATGSKDLFKITEVKTVDGYKLINGVELDLQVDLAGITESSQITENDITLNVVGENASKYPEGYFKTNVTKDGMIQIIIPNESTNYEFVLNKKDENNNLIIADVTENGSLDGAILSVEESNTGSVIIPGVILQEGTASRILNTKPNTTYMYMINEVRAKAGYKNPLSGYILVVYVVTDENGQVKDINSNDPTNEEYTRFGLVKLNPHTPVTEEEAKACVNLNVAWVNGRRQVTVDIINPNSYNINLRKLNTEGNLIEQVKLNATKVVNGQETNIKYEMDNVSSLSIPNVEIHEGEEQVWRIREEAVITPYYNVLPNGKYVDVRVKLENGKLNLLGYNVYNSDKTISNVDEGTLNISVSSEKINGSYVLNIDIINPMKYKVDIRKVEKDVEGNLNNISGARISVEEIAQGEIKNSINTITNEKSIEITKVVSINEIAYLKIREIDSTSVHTNMFKDKYIEIQTWIDENRKLQVNGPQIYYDIEGIAKEENLIPTSDEIYDYIKVESNGFDEFGFPVFSIVLLNPNEFDLEITKVKTDEQKSELPGATITLNGKYIIEEGASRYNFVDTIKIGEEKEYWIKEIETVGNHVNVLENMELKVTVKMNAQRKIEIVSKEIYKHLYNGKLERLTDEQINEVLKYIDIYTEVDKTTKRNSLKIKLQNPVEYRMKVSKVKTDNTSSLYGATITLNDKTIISHNSSPNYNGLVISRIGEVRTFDIKETKSRPGYVNVLGENKILRVKACINAEEKLEILSTVVVDKSKTPETETPLNECEELRNYITVTTGITNNVEEIIVKIENPKEYKFTVRKLKSNKQDSLVGAIIKVNGEVVMDGKNSEYDIVKNLNIGEKYTITIEEDETVKGNVNILKDKKYIVTATVLANEKLNIEEKVVYKNDETETPITDENILRYFSISQEMVNNINQVSIKIVNPEEYTLKVVKVDKDTKERMNGITFDVNVIDQEGNNVVLKDSTTMENKNLQGLITGNVNGEDGIIVIPNILIEKTGTFTYIFTERPKDLYESIPVIKAKVTISEEEGNYKVTNIEVIEGNEALNNENTKIIMQEPETVQLEVENERIKGTYDLVINKVDKATEEKLKGAKFEVTIERNGEVSELYKATDDVNSKDVIIPTNVEIKNGSIVIENIRIEKPEEYVLKLKEVAAPNKYLNLDEPIELKVVTDIENEKYVLKSVEQVNNKKLVKTKNDSNKIEVTIANEQFDLALRKFITGVTNVYGEEQKVTNRIPVFIVDENGKYIYDHTKDAMLVANENIVEYTIRVYNEGTVDGYATEVKDDIPEGLEFLPDDDLNKEYRWIMIDEKGNETEKVNEAKYIVTDYLSKENESEEGEYLLKEFDITKYEAGAIKEPDYKEVKVKFKVTIPNTSEEIIVNQAQISEDSNKEGNPVTDKDSTPNEWIENEDDQDIEKIKVQCFDLSLRKWVTKAIVIEDGKETIHETGHKAEDDPEAVVKVDLKKSKIDDVVVKFEYKIRVKNESKIPGSVEEISDYIPQGLKFVKADNPEWEEREGKVVTNSLSGKILNKDETAEVTIILTWINRQDNMGLKVNVAEISKDYNEYGSPDIDSIPNNKLPDEDDIDTAPVMIAITTGQTVVYIGFAILVLSIIAGGTYGIKKYVLK